MATYFDLLLSGEAKYEDIDEWVERWHESPEDGIGLHEYLGMTWDEYGDWARWPSLLPRLVEQRKKLLAEGLPLHAE